MRHICIFLVFCVLSMNAYARTITLEIPDSEIAVVANDVVDPEQWIREAWAGKYQKCLERAAKQYEVIAKEQGLKTMPVEEVDKANALLALPGYKTRAQRDAIKLQEMTGK